MSEVRSTFLAFDDLKRSQRTTPDFPVSSMRQRLSSCIKEVEQGIPGSASISSISRITLGPPPHPLLFQLPHLSTPCYFSSRFYRPPTISTPSTERFFRFSVIPAFGLRQAWRSSCRPGSWWSCCPAMGRWERGQKKHRETRMTWSSCWVCVRETKRNTDDFWGPHFLTHALLVLMRECGMTPLNHSRGFMCNPSSQTPEPASQSTLSY